MYRHQKFSNLLVMKSYCESSEKEEMQERDEKKADGELVDLDATDR